MCACVHVCTCAHEEGPGGYEHTCTHAHEEGLGGYEHLCVHAAMRPCVHACMRACVHVDDVRRNRRKVRKHRAVRRHMITGT